MLYCAVLLVRSQDTQGLTHPGSQLPQVCNTPGLTIAGRGISAKLLKGSIYIYIYIYICICIYIYLYIFCAYVY